MSQSKTRYPGPMRQPTACLVCRKRRRKCTRLQQGTSCDYCNERKIDCLQIPELPLQQDGYEAVIPRRRHVLTQKCRLLPPNDLCRELIDLYFRYIHVAFHVLFHQPSFTTAFEDGSLPKILLYGVIGLSARFSQHEGQASIAPRERGRPYIKEAERLLNLHDISIVTIQACMLLGAAAVVEGEGATEAIYFSIACRMAMLLDIPSPAVGTCIDQEIQTRLWWTLYGTDTWSSSGVRLPKVMPRRNVPLPIAEDEFLAMPLLAPSTPTQLVDPSSPSSELSVPANSILAHSVLLNQHLAQIDQINSQVVSGDLHGESLFDAVHEVALELESWRCSLPENMHNTRENLEYWTSKGLSTNFVHMHIDFNHFNQLLFYQFLHGNADRASPSSVAHQYSQKCQQHATELCQLIHLTRNTPRAQPLYSLGGHVLTIASTVLLHIFLFGTDKVQQQDARQLLEKNFEFLTTLSLYWPCLDASFARFKAFHDACICCLDDSHFQMDQWMLKFMLEFAEPVTERWHGNRGDEPGSALEWSLDSIGL